MPLTALRYAPAFITWHKGLRAQNVKRPRAKLYRRLERPSYHRGNPPEGRLQGCSSKMPSPLKARTRSPSMATQT
jgi:hypothetical protein